MSRHNKKQSRGRSDAAESGPPPLLQMKTNPQSATQKTALESLIGNAALADAKTNEPLTTQNNLLQSSYGNAAVENALVQRKPEGEEVNGLTPALGQQQQSTEAQPATGGAAATAPAAKLIVEDSAETLEPGQMRKSDFLSRLRASVSSTTAEALADTQWSEAGCPYIDQWFAFYNAQGSVHVEQAVRRYAREAAGATSASSYIPIVTGRVRRSVITWATTGEVTGLPEGGPGLPGGGVMGALAGAASGIADAASGVVAGVGSTLSAAGSVLFKEREGGAKEADDPQAIQARLGAGQSLDGSVKSRMESAFGESFSGVQVHTDANAAGLSSNLNSRAFTVGAHVAFGAGEYQPGTLVGDALIAHELAHVMQQRRGEASQSPAQKGAGYSGLEEDADRVAVGAVVSSWSGLGKGLANVSRNALPNLKSGLRLQRCGKNKPGEPDEKRLGEIRKILETIPTGKEALKIMTDYNVEVRFRNGGGTAYVEASNIMVIDSTEPSATAALNFVHEINHAKNRNEKTAADPKVGTRADYIKKRIEEESEGTVKSIEAKMELEGTTIDVSKATFPLEAQYRAAYKAAVDAAKAANPAISEADLKKIGREAGLKRVIKGFTDGEVITSNTKEKYSDYYGKDWDNMH